MQRIDNLDIRHDEVFRAVFTKETPQSRAALTGLLSAFLERKVTVVSVTPNELAVSDTRQRQIRYDKRTWQLSIAGNDRFFDDTEPLHQFYYYDPKRRISLGGLTSILTLELSKLEETLKKPVAEMNGLERWSVFIRYYTDKTKRELLQEIWAQEEAIRMAMQVVQGFTQDELEFFRKMSRERNETAWDDALDEAREDAFAEGEAKGFVEGQLKLLALLKSGKTPEEAEQILGLKLK